MWSPFCCVCDSLHTAELYVRLWLLHCECIVGAVTGSWAALFAKGRTGYVPSSFRSTGFRSSIGNVRWVLRKAKCLFTYAPSATEGCLFPAELWLFVCHVLWQILPSCVYSQDILVALVSGWAGEYWSERIASQGVFTWLCVVLCRVCRWLHEALNTTALQEKEKTLQRMKRKCYKAFKNINNIMWGNLSEGTGCACRWRIQIQVLC